MPLSRDELLTLDQKLERSIAVTASRVRQNERQARAARNRARKGSGKIAEYKASRLGVTQSIRELDNVTPFEEVTEDTVDATLEPDQPAEAEPASGE